jgi:hypothetical protein
MLDAFIIEKIRQESEHADHVREPLRIEISRETDPATERRVERAPERERGVAIIDFSI